MGTLRELRIGAGRRIPLDRFTKAIPRLATVRARPDIRHPANHGVAKGLEPGVIRERLGNLMEVGLDPHIGADPLVGPRPATDLVTAIAAIRTNQVVALDELRGRRLGELLARLQINDLMMALEAARFLEPLRKHRKNPVVIVEPPKLIMPLMRLLGGVGRVRCPLETRRTPLPPVADGAAEVFHWVRARISDKQVEPRMGGVGLRHPAADGERQRLA